MHRAKSWKATVSVLRSQWPVEPGRAQKLQRLARLGPVNRTRLETNGDHKRVVWSRDDLTRPLLTQRKHKLNETHMFLVSYLSFRQKDDGQRSVRCRAAQDQYQQQQQQRWVPLFTFKCRLWLGKQKDHSLICSLTSVFSDCWNLFVVFLGQPVIIPVSCRVSLPHRHSRHRFDNTILSDAVWLQTCLAVLFSSEQWCVAAAALCHLRGKNWRISTLVSDRCYCGTAQCLSRCRQTNKRHRLH